MSNVQRIASNNNITPEVLEMRRRIAPVLENVQAHENFIEELKVDIDTKMALIAAAAGVLPEKLIPSWSVYGDHEMVSAVLENQKQIPEYRKVIKTLGDTLGISTITMDGEAGLDNQALDRLLAPLATEPNVEQAIAALWAERDAAAKSKIGRKRA